MIIRAFSKLTIIKDLGRIFGAVRPRERENISGVKIRSESDAVLIYKPMPVIDVSHLYDCIHAAMLQQRKPKDPSAVFLSREMNPDLRSIIRYFTNFARECKMMDAEPRPLWREGAVSSNGILARLISFRSPTFSEEPTQSDSRREHPHEDSAEITATFLPGALIGQQ